MIRSSDKAKTTNGKPWPVDVLGLVDFLLIDPQLLNPPSLKNQSLDNTKPYSTAISELIMQFEEHKLVRRF